jgi:2-C-methyl-D-erythritol 4-phosphate cytidylyltransferase
MLSVIIVAAGSSQRMGFDKLMASLNGKSVLAHTVNAFLQSSAVSEIILVSTEERYYQLGITDSRLKLTSGGKNRHDSVSRGIAAVAKEAEYIAVHDGARPFISQDQINRTIEAAKKYGAATSAAKITDTVKRSNTENFVIESISRENLWAMETPQIFKSDLLKKAYLFIDQNNLQVTDEVSALELINIHTYLVENLTPNTKITYPQDLEKFSKK